MDVTRYVHIHQKSHNMVLYTENERILWGGYVDVSFTISHQNSGLIYLLWESANFRETINSGWSLIEDTKTLLMHKILSKLHVHVDFFVELV